jgi:hypothetical protein
MDRTDIEDTIRQLNACIPDPDERMSEAAISLMVHLMKTTIDTMENEVVKQLTERGLAARKTG